jgi:hypothetical protein
MITKTINITLGVLVAFTVWCAALMFAIFAAMIALHIMMFGGFTVYHLLNL